jgi:hypothetical protein
VSEQPDGGLALQVALPPDQLAALAERVAKLLHHDEGFLDADGAAEYLGLSRLARAPRAMTVTQPEGRSAFKGAKFATVGDDRRVNGGCVGLNNAGTEWACYVGQRAVAEGILDRGVLGQTQAGPAGG